MSTIPTVTLNPTVDAAFEVDRLISEGKNRARRCSVRGGGGGINVARCVGRLGGSAVALHTSGREVGRRLDRLLDEEGLDHRRIEIGSDTRDAFVVAETFSATAITSDPHRRGSGRRGHTPPQETMSPSNRPSDNTIRAVLVPAARISDGTP
ncbi:PfkB family carbohydrate kinase [Nocardia sp. NPDC004278]